MALPCLVWRSSLSCQSISDGFRRRNATTAIRCLSIGRMLDMGGAPSALNDKSSARINASKNCRVQAVAFDFHVLTSAVADPSKQQQDDTPSRKTSLDEKSASSSVLGNVLPDTNAVQQVASLLRVNLGGDSSSERDKTYEMDDLSILTGEKKPLTEKKKPTPDKNHSIMSDIRSKYADKLAQRGLGGVSGVDLAKKQVEETLKRGDAGGHLAARKIAINEPSTLGKRWIAQTGTGSLLQYMTQRSIKICLLPKPSNGSAYVEDTEDEGALMVDFTRQLKDVVFDVLLKDGSDGAKFLVKQALEKLNLHPNLILLVSDRDDYLKAAKEIGMITCRIRPTNARRGNISSNYMIPSIPEVRSVIDDMNGISFNAVFKQR